MYYSAGFFLKNRIKGDIFVERVFTENHNAELQKNETVPPLYMLVSSHGGMLRERHGLWAVCGSQ